MSEATRTLEPVAARPGGLRGLVASVLLAVGMVFPVTSIAMACYSKNALGARGARAFLLYAAFIALMLALLNAGKMVEADELFYLRFLRVISDNIQNGFARAVLDATGRPELGFYSVSYVLFKLSGGSIKVVTVFWTFITYLLSALAFARLLRDQLSREYALAIFATCAMIFINFALTAQVTRQYAAGAMVVMAFAYFDRRFLSLGLILAASLVHNSGIVFLMPWLFVWWFGARIRSAPPLWLMIAVFGGLLALGSAAYSLVEYLTGGLLAWFSGAMLDSGDITAFKVFSMVISIGVIQYEMTQRFDRRLLPFATGMVFLICLVTVVWKLPLFLLRFSFYVEFFAAISVAMLLFRAARRLPGLAVVLLPILANVAILIRASSSPWTYNWLRDGVLANFVGDLMVRTFGF